MSGTSSRSIRRVLEGTLVGHLEAHLQQLEELTPGTVQSE
jgi:hypothetical protein